MPAKKSTTTLELSHEYLLERLSYDSATGVFTWSHSELNLARVRGKTAGCYKGKRYAQVKIDGLLILVHRLAWFYMTKEWPKGQIDHINHDRNDNSWNNLRDVTCSENGRNRRLYCTNVSGAPGVSWCTTNKKWLVQIRMKDPITNLIIKKHLGMFGELNKAVELRKQFEELVGYHPNHGK